MRWTVLLGVACGCNPLFGIQATDLVDAPPPIDAPPPPVCPATGIKPTFGIELTQVPARTCVSYMIDQSGSASAAMCYAPMSWVPDLASGPVGSELVLQAMPEAPIWVESVRMVPEGDRILITAQEGASPYAVSTAEYDLVDSVLTQVGKKFSPVSNGAHYVLSSPTRGPRPRVLASIPDPTTYVYELVEYEYEAQALKELFRTPLTVLDVTSIESPSLSADGLRLVFTTSAADRGTMGSSPEGIGIIPPEGTPQTAVLYVDRADLTTPFNTVAQLLDTVPVGVTWPQLTEDCGRIYFSALDTVWYLRQLQ